MVHATPGLQAAIAALRQSLASRNLAGPRQPAGRAPPRAPAQTAAPTETAGSNVATLGVRLAAVSKEGAERRKSSLRLFIEAVLLDEFGSALVLDPALQELVDRTAQAIESDSALSSLVDASLKELAVPPP